MENVQYNKKKKESVIKGILKFTTQHKQWTISLSVLGDKTFLLNVQAVRISLLLLPVGRLLQSSHINLGAAAYWIERTTQYMS